MAAEPPRLADAAQKQDKAALRALITVKAAVNAQQPDGATALHWAVHWDDLESDLLLRVNANVNARTITAPHRSRSPAPTAMPRSLRSCSP
jgi:hypothetical protein